MPELPEVQTVCNDLIRSKIVGVTIKESYVYWARILHNFTIEEFDKVIKGKKITKIQRRGKFIHILLDKQWNLFIHLRMSGRLSLMREYSLGRPHEHVVLRLSDGRGLIYHDTRKFGRWYLTKNPHEVIGHLGLEPISAEFTVNSLKDLLLKSKTRIKPFLLNQKYIAGVGNIYADEALFLAGVHPESISCNIPANTIALLQQSIQSVLNLGIKNLGTTLGTGKSNFYSVSSRKGQNKDRLKVFRREGEMCFQCKEIIVKTVVAQRGTHFCPHCQIKY